MSSSQSFIHVVPHFAGVPKVTGSRNVKMGSSELEPPELDILPAALSGMKPGELLVIKDEQDASKPLVLASHGKQADLGGKEDLIESARQVGRSVEIHVFDDPDLGR